MQEASLWAVKVIKPFLQVGQLIVLKGKEFMIVIVEKMGEDEQITAEKAIAQKANDVWVALNFWRSKIKMPVFPAFYFLIFFSYAF